MKTLKGIGASEGIVIAPAYVIRRDLITVDKRTLADAEVEEEQERFRKAVSITNTQLEEARDKLAEVMGEDKARIIEAQILLLNEPVIKDIEKKIAELRLNAGHLVVHYLSPFLETVPWGGRLRGDMEDLLCRLLSNLEGVGERRGIEEPETESVLVIERLAPSETASLFHGKYKGIVTEKGGPTSHVSIMAQTMDIPAVVSVQDAVSEVNTGDMLILDGKHGMVYVNPPDEVIERFRKIQQRTELREEKLLSFIPLAGQTKDGQQITVSANIEIPEEIDIVKKYNAEGVGLFRTEVLYISRNSLPTEEEQREIYSFVAREVYPNSVIIRSFDFGGDKVVPGISFPLEANPFLGWRAIRIGLDVPTLFLTQMRAILAASYPTRNIKIMIPMISDIDELKEAKELLEKAKQELTDKGIPYDEDIRFGIMVEVPSVAIRARDFAEEVDFFSIGTNDLTQYTLAVDRGNGKVSRLYQPFHPAVLRLIRDTISGAHRNKIWVGVCGEMAGDPWATPLLLGLGVDELSMPPRKLPVVKAVMRALSYRDCSRLAGQVLGMKTAAEVKNLIREFLEKHLPQEIFSLVVNSGYN
ncbi:phosphoenolpyruvate--protein phosphotransferase [bacterium]|nr:phosphoenolpyruvate--protein phosphotransferase [bacterium]